MALIHRCHHYLSAQLHRNWSNITIHPHPVKQQCETSVNISHESIKKLYITQTQQNSITIVYSIYCRYFNKRSFAYDLYCYAYRIVRVYVDDVTYHVAYPLLISVYLEKNEHGHITMEHLWLLKSDHFIWGTTKSEFHLQTNVNVNLTGPGTQPPDVLIVDKCSLIDSCLSGK